MSKSKSNLVRLQAKYILNEYILAKTVIKKSKQEKIDRCIDLADKITLALHTLISESFTYSDLGNFVHRVTMSMTDINVNSTIYKNCVANA